MPGIGSADESYVNIVDRVFGCLMVLAALVHTVASLNEYKDQQALLMWGIGTGLAKFLTAALNLLRTWRPGDHALAGITLTSCLGCAGLAVWVGLIVNNLFDIRAFPSLLFSFVLALFSLRSLSLPNRRTHCASGSVAQPA